ncbi:MAG TPA: DUF302 domain-containing protein [Thermoanaerobaculia bacterium]|nr:DUF302 domain-containing protein [Thermoanaerobaculia bacterium]
MDRPAALEHRFDLSDYLAAERTFLAWLRTGVALMGFGFVVARFGILLQELRFSEPAVAAPPHGISRWFGTALMVGGIAVIAHSAQSYARTVRDLDRGEPARPLPPSRVVVIAAFLAVFGLALAWRMVSVPDLARGGPGKSEETAMASAAGDGLVTRPSSHSVDQTLERLESLLRAKGVTIFAVIDHSGEAAKVGIEMPPTKLLIFGNPKAGTPLMLAAPGSAIDLPLKILIWADAQGKVWVTYNSPAYLQQRHHLPPELLPNIAVVEALAAKAAE